MNFFYYCRGSRPTEALLDTTPEAASAWKNFVKNETEWSNDAGLEIKFIRMLRRGIDLPCHPYGEYARSKYMSAKEKTLGIKRLESNPAEHLTAVYGLFLQQRCPKRKVHKKDADAISAKHQ